jgi:U1 small nuclear ribonucleoprotein C
MPRFFDDYSNTYLTHDSSAGRKQQRRGWKFRENFKLHYETHIDEWRGGEMGLASAQQAFLRARGSDDPAVPPLPDGWEEDLDEATGISYYYEKSTGKRQWVRPGFIPPAPGGGRGPPPPNRGGMMMGQGGPPPSMMMGHNNNNRGGPPPPFGGGGPPPPGHPHQRPPPSFYGRPPPPIGVMGMPPPQFPGGPPPGQFAPPPPHPGGPPPPTMMYQQPPPV